MSLAIHKFAQRLNFILLQKKETVKLNKKTGRQKKRGSLFLVFVEYIKGFKNEHDVEIT